MMPGEWDWMNGTQDVSGIPTDDATAQLMLKRRLAQADLLKGAEMPQGQMVSGHYVAPSWTQYLANAVGKYQGGQQEKQAMQGYQDYQKTRSQQMGDILDQLGKPEADTSAIIQKMTALNPEFGAKIAESRIAARLAPPKIEYKEAGGKLYGFDQYGKPVGEAIGEGKSQFGTVNPSDFTPESLAKFAESGGKNWSLLQKIDKPIPTSDIGKLLSEMNALPPNSPLRATYQQAITKATRIPQEAGLNEPLVPIMGKDGSPIYVPRSQAIGAKPYSAVQEAKDVAKVQQQKQSEISTQQVLDQAQTLFSHPGRELGTGTSSWVGAIPIVSTKAKDFQKQLDTFKAQTFIPMVSSLKGMGALSDAEGRKLSESVGALDPNMSEAEFARSLKDVTKTLYDKAKAAGLNVQLPTFAENKVEGKKIIRTGTDKASGRKVIQYSDGTTAYAE